MSHKKGVLFSAFSISLIFALAFFLNCSGPKLDMEGWKVVPNLKNETLEISQVKLGLVLTEAKLKLEQSGKETECNGWEVQKENESLVIKTTEPVQATWTITASPQGLNIECSEENGAIAGSAPASKDRIPARTENQDNGIMYTSLGMVTATNIHSLFDRNTDVMIRFPQASQLVRCADNPELMNVMSPLLDGDEITLIQDYYINELGLKFYKPKPTRYETAPVAWSSWYCYYMGTTEEDMVTETNALAKHLAPYGLEYVQLDACYTRGAEANYLEWTKETFPKGGKWLFDYISSKGLKPALWVNIYGSNYEKAECADKYPENYYLRDVNGKLSSACCTADTTVVRLDYSNPDVIENHLKPMFRILKDQWGMKYLKDAGWGTWMDYYEKNKSMAFDSSRDSREVYLDAQRALRETLGDDVYIGGCAMHEVGLGFGIFDGSRIGGDDKALWYPPREGGMSMQTYFHSLFGANYLNNITWHCDPDAAMVRNPLSQEEGRTVVTAIALTGQLYMASDFMARLPHRKLELYQKTIPTTPIVPIDLYPYKVEKNKRDGVVWCCPHLKEFPRAIDLKVNNVTGNYDVVAMFNWDDEPGDKTIQLGQDLGLDAGKEYVVFDFWEQKMPGKTGDKITEWVPAHGTKAYVIREVAAHPQFLANSRHITGAVSMKDLKWDDSVTTLSGTSEVVKGAPYSIFIHVPTGQEVKNVTADVEVLYHNLTNEILEVKLSGDLKPDQPNAVNWSVKF